MVVVACCPSFLGAPTACKLYITSLRFRAADPILDLFLEDQQDNTVLVCLVKRDGYKVSTVAKFDVQGNPNHPYRLHPLIKLQSIPTIIQFKDGKEVGRCVEKECRDEDKLYAMMD